MEKDLQKTINIFHEKINHYYNTNIFNNDTLRKFNGTNINLLKFYEIYSKSNYFKNETPEDMEINTKIIHSLIDIILLNIIINEIDKIDNIGIRFNSTDDEFSQLYNISKAMNVINKTRILWERIMNFIYLLIERKVLDDVVPKKKSKKNFFKDWFVKKNYKFLEEYHKYITIFDDKYRTPETHKSSSLRKYFIENKPIPIIGVSLKLTLSFGTNIYPNILNILKNEKYFTLTWQRVKSSDGQELPSEFNEIPEWVEKYCSNYNLDVNTLDSLSTPYEFEN